MIRINMISDLNKFFKIVDECKGRVEVVSPEGDCIVLNSKLCRFVLSALIETGDVLLDSLELRCENPDDTKRFLRFMMEGC